MNTTRKQELLQYVTYYLKEEAREHSATAHSNELMFPLPPQAPDALISPLPPQAPDALIATLPPQAQADLWLQARALMNVRPPWPASDEFLAAQNELLQGLIEEAGIHTLANATQSKVDPRIFLWRGDITTLAVDAIVNAANSGMTGCWAPLHFCIDNAIHTFAGVQLRAECAALMQARDLPESISDSELISNSGPILRSDLTPLVELANNTDLTATALVTSAYNLPCRWVIHTVGPIASGQPTIEDAKLLAQTYIACLNAAVSIGARSIAFPCISTGVFGYPQGEAAQIAVKTVRDWLDERPCCRNIDVVFNVFGETDEQLYKDLLGL